MELITNSSLDNVLHMLDDIYVMAQANENHIIHAARLIGKFPSIHHYTPRLEEMGVLGRVGNRRYWADIDRQPDEAMAQELLHRVSEFNKLKRRNMTPMQKPVRPLPAIDSIMAALARIEEKVAVVPGLPQEIEHDLEQLTKDYGKLLHDG